MGEYQEDDADFNDLLENTPEGATHDLLTAMRSTGYTKIVTKCLKAFLEGDLITLSFF